MRRSRTFPVALALGVALSLATVADEPSARERDSEAPQASSEESPEATRAAYDTFIKHLRANFEDIHEVSMRFHLVDPTLNGMMVIRMTWVGGRLTEATIVENETNGEEANAIVEVLRRWQIEGLTGPATFTVPFRFRLVGSDDPNYPEMGILTGSATDTSGKPIVGAEIELLPDSVTLEPIQARANREGVFIRTLVPPGSWDLVCNAEGFTPVRVEDFRLEKGQHRIVRFELEPNEAN